MLFFGCRCERTASSAYHRTGSDLIDVRSRSVSQLWDSLAERQTIRIEYYLPCAYHGSSEETSTASDPVNLDHAFSSGMDGIPAGGSVKSVEITTERNIGRSAITADTMTNVSQASTKETLQQEAASEARQDNGTWIGIAVVAAVAALVYFVLKEVLS